MDSGLSIQEAAKRLGISEKTIRRRIKAGSLRASKLATSQGFEWRVHVDIQAVQVDSQHVQQPPLAAVQLDSQPQSSSDVLKALEIIERLQRENMELAGRLGFYQARTLELEERVKLLEAPRQEEPAQEAEQASPATPVTPQRGFWLRRLFGKG